MSEKSSDEERTEAVRALEAQFSDLIGQFRRVISENAHRVSPGLLPGAYKVFTTIARHETVTQATLADHLLLDKGQLSRTVRELEALGLITRSPDPADGRSSLLSPTAYGLERLAAARAPQEGVLVRALESWDVSDIDNLRRLLQALMAGINPDTVS
ncbi:MarR family winged helix-turn-helix transcriptional regulator [Microbacterium sp. BG28]|uniref:MarR family winged helix-turn-helix transcriptional regulator n=1 Tax=Microbacterium sp. BG28 TaxID=3097356 RepID=UPI002A5A8538|nr:MarR family winged helix-turn-helix transcriptional regulator [Microbacterium sp. BG28]MDY0827680.1 MarR family winged helix-turn-helix transcriptional regulator [Microbacterium sp. BG28]